MDSSPNIKILTSPAVLSHTSYTQELALFTDSSGYSCGAALCNFHPKLQRYTVIGYYGAALSSTEQNYSITELEFLAIAKAVKHFRHYLFGVPFIVYSDHKALEQIMKANPAKNTKFARMACILSEFQFKIIYKAALNMGLPDCLSRRDYDILWDWQLDEAINDGAILLPYKDKKRFEAEFTLKEHKIRDERRSKAPKATEIPQIDTDELPPGGGAIRKRQEAHVLSTPPLKVRVHKTLAQNRDGLLTWPAREKPYMTGRASKNTPCAGYVTPTLCQVKTRSMTKEPLMSESSTRLTDEDQVALEEVTAPGPAISEGKDPESDTELPIRPPEGEPTDHHCPAEDCPHCLLKEGFDFEGDDEDLIPEGPSMNRPYIRAYLPLLKRCHKPLLKDALYPGDLDLKARLLFDQVKQPLDHASCKLAQHADEFCRPLRLYLTTEELPDNDKLARKVLLLSFDYVIHDDLLYLLQLEGPKSSRRYNPRLVVPKVMIQAVIHLLHTNTLNAHQGIARTTALCKQHYAWRNMDQDIYVFVSSCGTCLRHKRSQHMQNPPFSLETFPDQPFTAWFVDLMGPLPKSGSGRYCYSLNCVEAFSRYTVTVPLTNKTAKQVARKLFDRVICVYGCFDFLRHDSGSEFIADVVAWLGKLMNFYQKPSGSYTPIAQGIVERLNGTIGNALRCLVNKKPNTWPKHLPACTFTCNNSPIPGGGGLTPFAIIHGCLPKFPAMTHVESFARGNRTAQEILGDLLESVQIAHELMKALNDDRRLSNKNFRAVRQKPSAVQPGAIVFMKIKQHIKASQLERRRKFLPAFDGPYVCTKRFDNNTINLKHMYTGKYSTVPVHLSKIKHVRGLAPDLYLANEYAQLEITKLQHLNF